MRFRITVRYPDKTELRGFTTVDSLEELQEWSNAMAPIGMVIASAADEGYDPFGEDGDAPTPEKSVQIIDGIIQNHELGEDIFREISWLHFMQAMVIRGERDQREKLQSDLQERELHHFEVEQENERLKADHTESEKALIDAANDQADVVARALSILDDAEMRSSVQVVAAREILHGWNKEETVWEQGNG